MRITRTTYFFLLMLIMPVAVAARIDKYIATAKPVKDGRVELIHYIKEQSISFEYHRYGSILEVPSVE